MLFMALSIPLAPAMAQPVENAPAAMILPTFPGDAAAALRQSPPRREARVIDQLRLQAEDNSIIELVGLEIPAENGTDPGDYAIAARDFLEKFFENSASRDLVLYQTATKTGQADKGRTNRLGHDLAQIVRKDGNAWVQGALIANGLARVRPTPANPELASQMYALEDEARTAKRGLWADDSPYRMRQADENFETLDRFAVVEGVVRNVATVNNVTYLNFGPDWKTDFTIGIPSATRQIMARQNIDVFRLQGQKLRVRGWIRSYNGPYIELEHPVLLQQEKNGQNSSTE